MQDAAVSEVEQAEVDESVVVVICGAGTGPVFGVSNAGVFGLIGERPVLFVLEQPIRRVCFGVGREGCAVDEVDIEPAVAVVIEQANAAAHGFNVIEMPVGAVGMDEFDACFGRHFEQCCGGAPRSRPWLEM